MHNKRCCFFISEVAGIIGKHPYKDQDEEIDYFLKRHKGEQVKRVYTVPEEYEKLVEELINSESSKHIGKTLEELKASEEEIENMKRRVYTERGIRDEQTAIEKYEEQENLEVECPTHFMKKHYIKNNTEFFIGGKIDGMFYRKKDLVVVEVKNRQSRVFHVIPEYERVQIECYMRILNSSCCVFIQRFEGKNYVQEYTINDELWKNILIELAKIVSSK